MKWKYTAFGAALAVGVILVLAAANPSLYTPWSAFRGTNEVNVRSNAAAGHVIIGPDEPISTIASNAATALNQWTNENALLHPVTYFGVSVLVGSNQSPVANATDIPLSIISDWNRASVDTPVAFYIDTYTGPDTPDGFFGIDVNVGDIGGVFTGAYDKPDSTAIWGQNMLRSTNSENIIYTTLGAKGVVGAVQGGGPGSGIGLLGVGRFNGNLAYAVAGYSSTAVTNIGVAGSAKPSTGAVGGYFEITSDETDPAFENSALLLDSRTTGLALLTARTNNGGFKIFEVQGTKTTNSTVLSSAQGFGSFSAIATNQIPTTGWTNNAGINVTVYATATAVSFTINNRAGTVMYTSPTLTATMPVNLQPGWSIRAASGLAGTVLPF